MGCYAMVGLLSGCTSIPQLPLRDTATYFVCHEQQSTTKHYATNTYAVDPTPEIKRNEALLVQLRLEKRLKTKLAACKEIPESEMPVDLEG